MRLTTAALAAATISYFSFFHLSRPPRLSIAAVSEYGILASFSAFLVALGRQLRGHTLSSGRFYAPLHERAPASPEV